MKELHPRLKVGTSSWSNAEWPFYPAGMKAGDFIGFYARHFPIVEVDSSFYHAPSPSLCARWSQAVPDSFRFALKVPQEITHEKTLVSAEKEWASFLQALSALKDKLAYLVLQFPYFNRGSSCPSLGEFLKRLGPFLGSAGAPCPLVVEVRNKTWVGNDLLDFLRGHRAIFALTDQEWMPKPRSLWEKHGAGVLTGPGAYLRLLGERKRIEALTETWDKLVIDRTPETRDLI
ncbi:MAG TPA: DUF72 domain-containing protein, partial [Planctomycetota bacterium]|nr:DUF72 domain-containing protein [Planctomycetota bacterium]